MQADLTKVSPELDERVFKVAYHALQSLKNENPDLVADVVALTLPRLKEP